MRIIEEWKMYHSYFKVISVNDVQFILIVGAFSHTECYDL